jgi:hypothetical protein
MQHEHTLGDSHYPSPPAKYEFSKFATRDKSVFGSKRARGGEVKCVARARARHQMEGDMGAKRNCRFGPRFSVSLRFFRLSLETNPVHLFEQSRNRCGKTPCDNRADAV